MKAVWLALAGERPDGAEAAAPVAETDGTPAGWLAGWSGPRPAWPGALRACPGILDSGGEAALVSLVLVPPGVRLAFDDPAVQQARRRVLAGRPAALCSTLLADDSHFEGALTAWRGDATALAPEDPFGRIFPARILRLGPGLLGRQAPPCGPTIERYGSGTPWPWDRFGS